MEPNTNPLKLDPPAKQAVVDCLANFKFGDVIEHKWLHEHFNLPEPQTSIEAHKRWSLNYLSALDLFRDTLLVEHQIALQSVRGVGYRLIPPAEQTLLAMKDLRHSLSKALVWSGQARRGLARLGPVR